MVTLIVFAIGTVFIFIMAITAFALGRRIGGIIALTGLIMGLSLSIQFQKDDTIIIDQLYSGGVWQTFTVDVEPLIYVPIAFTIFNAVILVYNATRRR